MIRRPALRRGRSWALDRLASLSPTLAAYGDWCVAAAVHSELDGPLNGAGRQELVRAVARSASPEAVIETGTHRGATTYFLWAITGAPTWTVEISSRSAAFAEWRLRDIADITVWRDESCAALRELASDSRVPRDGVFFYLDAHWGGDLPLHDELLIISNSWTDPVIMIDDFQVPDDPGYGFDDYGPGQRLTPDYLPLAEMGDVELLFPTCPSSAEGGLRRGCAVIASRERAAVFARDEVPLRSHGCFSSP